MASERDGVRAAEQTAVDGDGSTAEPDLDWPVAEPYLVEPRDGTVPAAQATANDTVVTTQSPVATSRRLPPFGPGSLAAIASSIAAVIVIAVFLGLREGDQTAAARSPTEESGTRATTPSVPTTAEPAATLTAQELRGTSLEEARRLLKEQGLRMRVQSVESDQPRGEVLSQVPPPGAKVEPNDVMSLVISAGGAAETAPKSADVPGVIGLAASHAVKALRAAKFDVRIQLLRSSQPAGTVIRQSPAEATEAPRGSEVVLTVARSRPAAHEVEVPDLVGMTADAAQRALRSAGFTVTVVTVHSGEPAGQVVGQSPRAGIELREGGAVTLRVSSGAAEVDVPDVTGLDEQAARLELASAGFQVSVAYESTTEPAEDGVVIRQTPHGGSMADEGSLVTVIVARLD